MSEELTTYGGIEVWKALPDDFVLTVHIDSKGHAITERIALTKEAADALPTSRRLAWSEKVAIELCAHLREMYVIKRGPFCCSDVRPDGTIEVYLQADVLIDKLICPDPLVKQVADTKDPSVIDI